MYSIVLFLLLSIVLKEFSNNRDLILGTFFSLWPNCFFLETKLAIKNRYDFCVSLYTSSFISLMISFAFKLLLILRGDVEVNPGPGHWTSLSFCHWNLNSIFAHDFANVSLLEAYNAKHRFDIPANIRLDKDVLKTCFFVVFRRRLHQDEYIRLTHTSSEDVFKTS